MSAEFLRIAEIPQPRPSVMNNTDAHAVLAVFLTFRREEYKMAKKQLISHRGDSAETEARVESKDEGMEEDRCVEESIKPSQDCPPQVDPPRITRGSQTPAVVIPDAPNAERLVSDLVAAACETTSHLKELRLIAAEVSENVAQKIKVATEALAETEKSFIRKADSLLAEVDRARQQLDAHSQEQHDDLAAPAKNVSMEVAGVRDIWELPPIPRKQDTLRLIDSFCEACNAYGHSIDTCERFPHGESRLERLLARGLCIKCGQDHSGDCEDVSRVCRSCGNCLHMFPLCRKRFGKEVLAAKYHRPDKTSGVAHAKPSSKKRTRKQAFVPSQHPSQNKPIDWQVPKPHAEAPVHQQRG
uniref:Uncharacterized protein n=1 Tax=Caenorhabditis japonica TaxID=281687 RepID=A0A8R1ICA9_CAEJA